MAKYEVIVGNIGTVYSGGSKPVASKTFKEYVKQSLSRTGRAGGEAVTLMHDGEPVSEHDPDEGEGEGGSYGTPMTPHQKGEFRGFCRQATDRQIQNIVEDERKRAASGDLYYVDCYDIAVEELERRGL